MTEPTSIPKIKIAHLQLLPLLSGVQRVTLDELTRLDPERYQCWLICQQPGPLTEAAEQAGIHCLFVSDLIREISPKSDSRALITLTKIFRRHQFNVVHTHSSKTGVLGRIAGKLANVPVVMHSVHGFAFPAAQSKLQYNLYLAMERVGTRFSDGIVFLNDTDKSIALNQLRAKQDILHLIPNGVDAKKFYPLADMEKIQQRQTLLNVEDDKPCVVMLGRLWRQKNPECFVNAAIALLDSGQQAHFFLVGDGECHNALQQRIRDASYSQSIKLLGWRNDIVELLRCMDVFVLPSRWEGMPLAILEAQASGLPVVATDIPGNRDLVADGEDGYLFPSEDANQLATKLKRLLDNKELRSAFGATAREKVQLHYRIEKRVEQIAEIYETQLKLKKGSDLAEVVA